MVENNRQQLARHAHLQGHRPRGIRAKDIGLYDSFVAPEQVPRWLAALAVGDVFFTALFATDVLVRICATASFRMDSRGHLTSFNH